MIFKHVEKQKKSRSLCFILTLFFILFQGLESNLYASSSYRPVLTDTIPTPKIITLIKKNIKRVFRKKQKDGVDSISTTPKKSTLALNSLKKDTLKTQDIIERNDTIKQILKNSVAQNYWTITNKPSIVVTQTSFINWTKGGNNTIAGIISFNGDYDYKRGQFFWTNSANIRYGLSREDGVSTTQKTEDIINLKSNFGYKNNIESEWYYSGDFSFNTQFTDGYSSNDNAQINPISTFFSPARLRLGIGAAYTSEENNLKLNLSPLTNQITFVLNQKLANQGAYGVDKAILDKDENIIQEGKNINSEFGILIRIEYSTTIMKNINFGLKSSFYTDYLNNFGNIDSDIEIDITMKVNEHIDSRISSHLLYDDDAVITEKDGTRLGPRLQLKQILGIGITYEF